MKTFFVGNARVVGTGGDCIKLSFAQFKAAMMLREACMSQEELLDLMEQLRDEPQRACMAKPKKPVDHLDWMPKKIAPSVAVPAPAAPYKDTEGWEWEKIADLGPEYKVRAVKAIQMKTGLSLKEAVDMYNSYLKDKRRN